jgi:hypothetical protein
MTPKQKGNPALQVQITILHVQPTAGQLAAYRRLWDYLLEDATPRVTSSAQGARNGGGDER